MKKSAILLIICLYIVTAHAQKNRCLIYFKSNESTINTLQLKQLDSLANIINKVTAYKIVIIGHTDSVGTFESNKALSLNRAITIESYFIKQKVNAKRITKEYYGYLLPIAPNKREADRAKNRRTEIVLYTDQELTALEEAKRTQTFFFLNNFGDIKITTKGGAKIRIPAKTLVSKNKNSGRAENIKIEIVETYSLSDRIDHHLHTFSKKGIMETGGMIKIMASDKYGELNMKNDSLFYVALPTNNKQLGMDLYSMSSDTAKYWEEAIKTGVFLKRSIGFFYALNGKYIDSDPIRAKEELVKVFGDKFLDTLAERSNYFFSSQKLNLNYNIDKDIEGTDRLLYDSVIVNNTDSLMAYMLILKEGKAIYDRSVFNEKKVNIVKGRRSYLLVYKYDILKNIVQYDLIEVTGLKETSVKLKTITVKKYKSIVDNLAVGYY